MGANNRDVRDIYKEMSDEELNNISENDLIDDGVEAYREEKKRRNSKEYKDYQIIKEQQILEAARIEVESIENTKSKRKKMARLLFIAIFALFIFCRFVFAEYFPVFRPTIIDYMGISAFFYGMSYLIAFIFIRRKKN